MDDRNEPARPPSGSFTARGRHRAGRGDDERADRAELTVEDLSGRRGLMVASTVQPATLERTSRWSTGAGRLVELLPDPVWSDWLSWCAMDAVSR
jgi:hypothetical protein